MKRIGLTILLFALHLFAQKNTNGATSSAPSQPTVAAAKKSPDTDPCDKIKDELKQANERFNALKAEIIKSFKPDPRDLQPHQSFPNREAIEALIAGEQKKYKPK